MRPNIPIALNTSDNNLDEELYTPCLHWSSAYDRGVGYFTSGWISKNSVGMASFASNGGKARWITSTVLDSQDYEIIRDAEDMQEIAHHFHNVLLTSISQLATEIRADICNAFGWMIFDGIIQMRFAIPKKKLAGGDFHDKFGIFYGENDEKISFSSSMNDSQKGFSNYESFKVFKSWDGTNAYIQQDIVRFEKLWNNEDENIDVFEPAEAIKKELFKLRTSQRPYDVKEGQPEGNKWKHQDEAVSAFLSKQNGILEMATGTGKTKTALKIIDTLYRRQKIKRVIITMYGNDLLAQWEKELFTTLKSQVCVFRYFDTIYKELPSFVLSKNDAILLVSRDENRLLESINRLIQRDSSAYMSTLLIFDEVHGLGSPSLRNSLTGKLEKFKYRLGLSATPEREYDDEGNQFIRKEVGPVIFRFPLEAAIRRGILCEFDYISLDYQLTVEERQKKRDIIAGYEAKRKRGEFFNEESMYRDLAAVNKMSKAKLPLFKELISTYSFITQRCIIFVATRDYGISVQNLLIDSVPDFHTYYSEDDKSNLQKFANGTIDCLITCEKISEGVDIQSVKHVILFSSNRGKLDTTQRIGRCLRINPGEPEKRAVVVDFVCEGTNNLEENSADAERKEWLSNLSAIRRMKNEDL